ncbi:MAG TPA: GNAT family N-acetyltransferase [Pseudoflavonifractor sp.]|nr:GNAT family N-acetyltransferase [Pseudoflavonifractor sp.]
MNEREWAVGYLERDRLRYMNLLEVFRRGSAEMLLLREDGLLLRDRESLAYMLTAESHQAASAMIAHIPRGSGLCVAHQDWYLPVLRARLGLGGGMTCHQAAWLGERPPESSDFPGELRPLDAAWAPRVRALYGHDYADEAYIAGAVERGMLGAFVDGSLAGFVGTHDEGTIGLLQVLPQYRRLGVGEALYRAMIRRRLDRGGYALAHIEAGNEASLALQRKVGMALSAHLLYWMF